TNAENGNPAANPTTLFAVQVVTTTPADATWLNQWVDAAGNPSATAVWLTDAALDALTLTGLNSSTTYGVRVKARNENSDETALSAEGQGVTTSPAPPTAPTSLFTHDTDASAGDTNPILSGTVPRFSAIYNDPNGGDIANGYSIQVDDNSDFSSPIWDSDLTASDFGRFNWAKRLGGTDFDNGYEVITDSNNNLIVTGYVTGNADMNGDGDSVDGGAEDATGYGNFDAFISVFDSSGVWQWAKRLGGTGADEAFGVTTDGSNNIIVTGYVKGAADMNGDGDFIDGAVETTGYGLKDAFISVFDSSGTWQWAKRFGGGQADGGYSVVTDSNDNIIVSGEVTNNGDLNGDGDSVDGGAEDATGYGNNDGFISVFDSSGVWQWAKRLGGTVWDSGMGLATDSNNNIIVTGFVTGAGDLNGDGDFIDGAVETTGNGLYDPFISVFDSSGVWQWAKRLGGTDYDYGYDVATDSNDNIIMSGTVNGAADLNGDGDSLDGAVETTGHGDSDGYISVFDSSGVWQWAKRLGGTGFDDGQDLTIDSNNNVIVAGRVTGAGDLNGDGDSIDGIAEDATGAAHGLGDVYISVFNSSGTWQWAERLGGTGEDMVFGVTADSNNNIIVTGLVTGNADLNGDGDSADGGAEDATGYGSDDVFIAVFQQRASMANCSEGNRCADIVYAGDALGGGTQYFWRIRFYDDEENEGSWSAGGGANHFTTATPTTLYRSVGVDNTDLNTGQTVEIVGTTATF
ncbi:MAG: SBBP repeat-containing protein, partial [Gammaproteobacteria bacterium]